MIPEIDTQLAAVIKALSDNVLPAVDAGNPMAAEQIQLCLATLGLVKTHLPELHRYLRRDLETHLSLARQIKQLADKTGVRASSAAPGRGSRDSKCRGWFRRDAGCRARPADGAGAPTW